MHTIDSLEALVDADIFGIGTEQTYEQKTASHEDDERVDKQSRHWQEAGRFSCIVGAAGIAHG